MADYWKKKQEDLCIAWLSATTRQQFQIYNALHGVLRKMTEIIANRYFSIPFNRQEEYYKDVINILFIKLKGFDPSKGTAYTFCSMLIKYRFYEIVSSIDPVKQPKIDYFDDLTPVDNGDREPLYDELEEFDVDRLYARLQTVRKKIIQTVRNERDGQRSIHMVHSEQLIQVLNLCIEYLMRFQNFNAYSVADYCCNNSTMNKATVGNHFHELFGIKIIVDVKPSVSTREEKEEDLTPIEINKKKASTIRSNKLRRDKYQAKLVEAGKVPRIVKPKKKPKVYTVPTEEELQAIILAIKEKEKNRVRIYREKKAKSVIKPILTPEELQEKELKRKQHVKEFQRIYQANNREKIREQARIYREEHREQIRANQIKWKTENIEKIREINRKWYIEKGQALQREENKTPEHRAYMKAYRLTHKKKDKKYLKAYRKAHRERCNQQQLNYYYRKKLKNNDILTITIDATPTNGSQCPGMLDSIPKHSNTETQSNAVVTGPTRTSVEDMV